MKPKRTPVSKPKLSFTVDRSEFDISSDWVQAVMAPPTPPAREAPFFSPDINNATGVDSPTGVETASVSELVTVFENAPVPSIAPDEKNSSVVKERDAFATVVEYVPDHNNITVAESATVANNARTWKLRPLRRITDGLTPGQYAVYSLMLTNCEAPRDNDRIYRGGYADLGRLTGLSKRGIQNVIGELQEKAVIRLHTAPGHHRTETSAYVIPDPEAVLQAWYARGWRFSVGKGKKLTNGTTVEVLATRGAA